jgi:hypothetical protein
VTPTNRSGGASVFNSVSFWTKQTASCAFQCSKRPKCVFRGWSPGSHFGYEKAEKSPGCKRGFRREIHLIFQRLKLNRECLSSIPPRAATHSGVRSGSRRDARMGRKSRLFAHSLSSLDSRFAGHEAEIAKSLRPFRRIFPFWGDFRRRRVRSGLPPDRGSPFRTNTSNKSFRVNVAGFDSLHPIQLSDRSDQRFLF